MEQILIDTLRQEIENLRDQMQLIQKRIDELETTLSSVEAECKLAASMQEADPEDEHPEVEVEFYVDHSLVDEDLLSDEEQEAEDTVEDVLVEEIEKTPEPAPEPAPQPKQEPVEEPKVAEEPKPAEAKEAPKGVSLPPVDDIRKAISLGDRFLFQRELFAGDGEKMNKTIDMLNSMNSLDEAMEYISKKFAWDTESQAYELFTNVLKRRF